VRRCGRTPEESFGKAQHLKFKHTSRKMRRANL
jgi:hypothetical protein